MKLGYCHLTVIPCRKEASDPSEMVTQLVFGEPYEILEEGEKWSRIITFLDKYECWISNNQVRQCGNEVLQSFTGQCPTVKLPLVPALCKRTNLRIHLSLGAYLHKVEGSEFSIGEDNYELIIDPESNKDWSLEDLVFKFLNTPYLWGGKSLFGIDCSGFTQMVYKLNGFKLLRDASQQATQGIALSFIEESEPGDLAFFDNNEGQITHVGIIMEDNYIIHAHGKVRIDRLDHSGIYNADKRMHTHKLRVIKKIV